MIMSGLEVMVKVALMIIFSYFEAFSALTIVKRRFKCFVIWAKEESAADDDDDDDDNS